MKPRAAMLVGLLASCPPSARGWIDDSLSASSHIRAAHITELRGAINAKRAACGIAMVGWNDDPLVPGVTHIRAIHLNELRNNLAPVLPPGYPAFTDAPVREGVTRISVAHIQELRAAVNAAACPCSCTAWADAQCGTDGGCGAGVRRQTRTCSPSACMAESQCSGTCCSCGGWSAGSCGTAGGCPDGVRAEVRSCSPGGCEAESRCGPACSPIAGKKCLLGEWWSQDGGYFYEFTGKDDGTVHAIVSSEQFLDLGGCPIYGYADGHPYFLCTKEVDLSWGIGMISPGSVYFETYGHPIYMGEAPPGSVVDLVSSDPEDGAYKYRISTPGPEGEGYFSDTRPWAFWPEYRFYLNHAGGERRSLDDVSVDYRCTWE